MSGPTVIAISGASASGKSLFAETVFQELSDELGAHQLAILSEDAYYKRQDHLSFEQRITTNYDHPSAFEHSLLKTHIQALKQGQAVDMPQYCYKTHTRLPDVTPVQPAQVILVEGIMLLTDPELMNEFDIKVFMDTALDICLLRRLERDIHQRGRDFDSVTSQYMATVRPMYMAFIEPSKQHADLIVTGGGRNRIAINMLKAQIHQLLVQ